MPDSFLSLYLGKFRYALIGCFVGWQHIKLILHGWYTTTQEHKLECNVLYKWSEQSFLKDVPGGIPKSDISGVTVARIYVAGQWF